VMGLFYKSCVIDKNGYYKCHPFYKHACVYIDKYIKIICIAMNVGCFTGRQHKYSFRA
jgi:hypothetical protein